MSYIKDDFETVGDVNLAANDNIGVQFPITIASSASNNDGWCPYGETVSSIVTVAYDKDWEIVTTDIIVGTPTVTNNNILVQFKYPAINGDGKYKLIFTLTFSNSDTKDTRFYRVRAQAR